MGIHSVMIALKFLQLKIYVVAKTRNVCENHVRTIPLQIAHHVKNLRLKKTFVVVPSRHVLEFHAGQNQHLLSANKDARSLLKETMNVGAHWILSANQNSALLPQLLLVHLVKAYQIKLTFVVVQSRSVKRILVLYYHHQTVTHVKIQYQFQGSVGVMK